MKTWPLRAPGALFHENEGLAGGAQRDVGFHGAGTVPAHTNGSGHGNGKQPVQTFAWATYLTPGIYARNNGSAVWAVQDIQPLSHEISEWADDPFDNNWVEPWVTPTAPQNGCTGVMETGDPVVGIGFAMGGNSYFQGANPNGTHSADGYYHPEDEVLLLPLCHRCVAGPPHTACV